MTEEIKRRGRPPKQLQEEGTPMTDQGAAPETEATHAEEAQAESLPKEMKFEEVMAWNRANADKLAPLPEKAPKRARKVARL